MAILDLEDEATRLKMRPMYVELARELERFKEHLHKNHEDLFTLIEAVLLKTPLSEEDDALEVALALYDLHYMKEPFPQTLVEKVIEQLSLEDVRSDPSEGYDLLIYLKGWHFDLIQSIPVYILNNQGGYHTKNQYPEGARINSYYLEAYKVKRPEDILNLSDEDFLELTWW